MVSENPNPNGLFVNKFPNMINSTSGNFLATSTMIHGRFTGSSRPTVITLGLDEGFPGKGSSILPMKASMAYGKIGELSNVGLTGKAK